MVIRFAPNKKNQKVVEEQAVWRGTICCVKISLESFCKIWKFLQFARFNSTLML